MLILVPEISAVSASPNHDLLTVQGNRLFRAEGAGSRLDLSGLTTLSGPTYFWAELDVQSAAAGVIDLSGLTSITDGVVQVLAEDSGSVVDLSSLTTIAGFEGLSAAARAGRTRWYISTMALFLNLTLAISGRTPL